MPDRAPSLGSVSLDLDNLWSYLKTHGDPGWATRPTYLPTFLPIVLDALAELQLTITFFVVGVDATRDENVEALRSIVAAGHEVGNHSYEHEPWLHRYAPQQLEEEIVRAEDAIGAAMGVRPVGFRGPGYSWSPTLFDVLARRGYGFDASLIPTFLGPLARMYYFATARLTPEERRERSALFGSWTTGFMPNTPFEWEVTGHRRLLEIPVTVCPGTRTPFHLSYLLYLARASEGAAIAYLRTALTACRLTGVEPSLLLHPLDLLGPEDAPAVRFFPGMNVSGAEKRRFFARVLRVFGERLTLVSMSEHARAIRARGALRTIVQPSAASPPPAAAKAG